MAEDHLKERKRKEKKKITRKSGFLEAKYEEIRGGSQYSMSKNADIWIKSIFLSLKDTLSWGVANVFFGGCCAGHPHGIWKPREQL